MAKRPAKRPLWICPRCGHRFVTANMWHSCGSTPLREHFRGKPARVRELYDAWHAFVRECGPFKVLSQKSRIAFQTRVRFAGAIINKSYVQAGFWLRRRVTHPALSGYEYLPPGYHLYRIRLTDESQLAARGLRELVEESYRLGLQEQGASRPEPSRTGVRRPKAQGVVRARARSKPRVRPGG